jgi:Fe-S-cluster-containing dehydrogenase component
MSLDRRNFFKAAGVAGLTLITGKTSGKELKEESDIEFKAILYDSTKCLGCRVCEIACAETNGLPEPQDEMVAGVVRKTSEFQRTAVNIYNTSKGEVLVKNQCMHCNEPACAAACLTQAMFKTKEGPVIWNADKCMGCRYCMVSCPFDVPKFEYHSANPKIQKCDMCYNRIVKGEIPACVEACGEALTFGTRRELIAEARKRIAENPDTYLPEIYGESIAGGTGILYLSPVPHNEIGFNTNLQDSSYPALTKGFLYSVPAVFILLPPLLLGIHEATKNNNNSNEE